VNTGQQLVLYSHPIPTKFTPSLLLLIDYTVVSLLMSAQRMTNEIFFCINAAMEAHLPEYALLEWCDYLSIMFCVLIVV
jgi:hypothetical protein